MARPLTKVEKFYIEQHRNLSPEVLAKDLAGVGPATVRKYLEGLPPAEMVETQIEAENTPTEPKEEPQRHHENEVKSILDGKSEEEKRAIVRDTNAHNAGNLMARRNGIVVMTEASSELADARKRLGVKNDPAAVAKQSQHIHRMK